MQSPNASGLALQRNIGLIELTMGMVLSRWARDGSMGSRVGSGRLRMGSAGVCVGSTQVFRYQDVVICNTKVSRWGYCPMQSPNASGFTLQWNIGLTELTMGMVLPLSTTLAECLPDLCTVGGLRNHSSGGWKTSLALIDF